MSDSLTTKVDRSYLDDATRADASRYLIRTNNADLLVILGLAVDVPDGAVLADGVAVCAACGNKLPSHGVCRRKAECREAARERGEHT